MPLPSPSVPPRLRPRPLRTLTRYLRTEAGGATVLAVATVLALVVANSPLADAYGSLIHAEFGLDIGRFRLVEDLQHWVNDGLMTVFFFVVGLEIKRELAEGELQDPRRATLPILAAAAGIVAPAVLYLAANAGGPGAPGWGIPVATDIAFAVGVLALLGQRVPSGLKVFLLTVAIADDVGAILIIAVAYSTGISGAWLATALATLAVIAVLRRFAYSPWVYVPFAVLAWLATLKSGIHATIAGVALGLLTPAGEVGARPDLPGRRVLEELEHRLHPWSSYLVLPLFAFVNAGVALNAEALSAAVTSRVTIGVVLGLVLGKTVGVSLATWAAVRAGIGRLPLGLTVRHIAALAPITGIGFTVSLFIADLSFTDAILLDEAKIGILAGSVLAGVLGALLLLRFGRHGEPTPAGYRGAGLEQRSGRPA